MDLISKRDAYITLELLHGRTHEDLAKQVGLSIARIGQIKDRIIQRSGYRAPYLYGWRSRLTTPDDLLLIAAYLRRKVRPEYIDPDSPEGFVLSGEIRTGRRPED